VKLRGFARDLAPERRRPGIVYAAAQRSPMRRPLVARPRVWLAVAAAVQDRDEARMRVEAASNETFNPERRI
jgi:hypothetical protein